jgi:hypothetical protein
MLNACKKDEPEIPVEIKKNAVFVINEGNFQWGNSSVTYFNFDDNTTKEDIFNSVNGRPLGDVAQSVVEHNGLLYIVVNNSGKIEIVNASNFSSLGTISGLTSPRYLLPVSDSKAYASDLYSNGISIINLNSKIKTGQIACKGSTEEMVKINNVIAVGNTRNRMIYLIDPTQDKITDSIEVGYGPNSLCVDKDNFLWAFCSGSTTDHINAGIYKIDVATKTIDKSFPLSQSLDFWNKMRINKTKDTLYYMNTDIFMLPVISTQLSTSPLISMSGKTIHGLGVNPYNGNIFVADAVDYVQKGKVYYYNRLGSPLGTISCGIIPVDFYFAQE